MESENKNSSVKKIGRPQVYENRETQISESRRKLKLKRCINEIIQKSNKFKTLALSSETDLLKNTLSSLLN